MIYDSYNSIEPLLEPVYNFKYNYIRVNGGHFNSDTLYKNFSNPNLHDDENKQKLYNYLNRFLHYQKKYNLSVKFDCAMEADDLYENLRENNSVFILDWINEWKLQNELNDDSIVFLTNVINVKEKTPSKYRNLVESFHKYRFYCAPALDTDSLENRRFNKVFYYNVRRPDSSRTNLYKFLKSNKILENSYWSYNVPDGNNILPTSLDESYKIERYYPNIPDTEFNYDEQFVGLNLMTKSFCHIIMETTFKNNILLDDGSGLKKERFFTEKTFKPIMACQPFILGSNSHDLGRLKSFGFKTFDRWWDESYDLENDDNIRLDKIKNIIIEISKKSKDELHRIYIDMIPILKYNINLIKELDNKFTEFQNNTIYTLIEGYEYPLSFYDIQEGVEIDNNWNILL